VCINRFTTDTDKEIAVIQRVAKANGAFDACVATHYAHGGAGAVELGKAVVRACAAADVASFKHAYDARNSGLKDKILAVVQKVYGGAGVQYTPEAEARIATIEANQAFKVLPVCMSKTQYSLSDDATKLGAPKGFEVTVKDVYVSAGAGFTVVSLGAISFIPGLPIKPAYYKIDLDLSEAVRRHRAKGAMASLITKRVPHDQVSSYGVVVTDPDGRVLSFQEKPAVEEAASDMINTGIYIFEPEVLDFIPSGESFDIGSDLFPKLVESGAPFYALPMEFEWVDIGKVPDYWQAIRSVLQGHVRQVQIPGVEVRPGIYTGLNVAANWDKINVEGPIYVGGMTRIEDGATIIGPAMIGPSCHICEGATIDNSIIFDYSRIGAGVRLVEKLVYGRYCVDRNGDHFDLQEASLDWLITDARRQDVLSPSPQQKAMAELLGSDLALKAS
jgi:NDP-sugar pyrophosphorylase family protein